MASEKKLKSPAKGFFIAGVSTIVVAIALVVAGIFLKIIPWVENVDTVGNTWGIAVGFWYLTRSFAVDLISGTSYWNGEDVNRLFIILFCIVGLGLTIALLVQGIKNKKHRALGIIAAVLHGGACFVAVDLFATAVFGINLKYLTAQGYFELFAAIGLSLFAALCFLLTVSYLAVLKMIEERQVVAVAAPVEEQPAEEEAKEEPKEEEKPVEEPVEEKKPEPVKEEKAKPAKKEEKPVVVAAVKEEDEGLSFGGSGRRRASFETKLKNSDEELRHQYYDLRDYIKSYGINNRISIPGDTFSAHRDRYVFITISGKHLKVNMALDPKKYAKGTIPVEKNTSKKFEDLPLTFKVRSGLSFRRACSLVDDVMKAKGVAKPEGKK